MRTLLIGALAATLAGCSCPLLPHASIEPCTDTNRFACFDRTAASWPVEPEPASFETDSETTEIESTIAAKIETPSSAHARDRAHLVTKTAKPTMIAAKVEPPSSRIPLPARSLKTQPQPASHAAAYSDTTRANIADSHPTGGAVANSNIKTMQEQVAAATAVAERMTVGAVDPAPEPEANNKDRSNQSETVLRGDAEKTAPASPNEPPASAQNQLSDTVWVVSETTSPVDYSPLITAVIRSTSSVRDAPNTLAVRCRGSRTELLLRTEGAWRASRASEVQVDHQINDQPLVRLQWTVSADGKTASYKDDAVELLRSLPEGARLKISVFVRQEGPGQEATFQLTGLDGVRKKIGLACKWPPTADKMSLGKR
jgi:Type VI secretion system VasI, EvfG, VC_A0118